MPRGRCSLRPGGGSRGYPVHRPTSGIAAGPAHHPSSPLSARFQESPPTAARRTRKPRPCLQAVSCNPSHCLHADAPELFTFVFAANYPRPRCWKQQRWNSQEVLRLSRSLTGAPWGRAPELGAREKGVLRQSSECSGRPGRGAAAPRSPRPAPWDPPCCARPATWPGLPRPAGTARSAPGGWGRLGRLRFRRSGPVSAPSARRVTELKRVAGRGLFAPPPPRSTAGEEEGRAPALRPVGPCTPRCVSQRIPALLCFKASWEDEKKKKRKCYVVPETSATEWEGRAETVF